jgi:hypothetical protein
MRERRRRYRRCSCVRSTWQWQWPCPSGASSLEAAALVSDGEAPDPSDVKAVREIRTPSSSTPHLTAQSWQPCCPDLVAQVVSADVAETGRGDVSPDAPVPRRYDAAADTLPLPPVQRTGRRRTCWPLLLVLVWAALAAVNIVLFGAGPSESKVGATRTTNRPHIAVSAATPSVSTPSPSTQPPLNAHIIVPVSAVAYGPTGPGSGDNPNDAADVIDASAATPWQTDWYRSAAFGNLQAGTGLLIDMGQPVTITSVLITLGSTPGADLEVLTGTASARSQMRVQASVSDVGGSVSLAMAEPESARYLLIWFTLLPPDAAGTFQATVYNVRIEGTP